MHETQITDDETHADVAVMPPLLFLGALALGCLMSAIVPLGPGLFGGNARAVLTGLAIMIAGVVLFALSARRFSDAGTELPPNRPASALVTAGPYALSRNPVYIALTAFYIGLAIALTSVWALLALPSVLVILQRGVVEREEAYLAVRFADAYRAYTARVPRWF